MEISGEAAQMCNDRKAKQRQARQQAVFEVLVGTVVISAAAALAYVFLSFFI